MIINTSQAIEHIIGWLIDYSQNSNTKGFVVGVSGGIDSSLVALLLAKTNKKVLCTSLPIHQNKRHLERVHELKDTLATYTNVDFIEVDMSKVFDKFQDIVKVDEYKVLVNKELSLANTRSRLRMTTLYYYAGLYNYLVVGTGNKIEDMGIGFFTKYGDGGVDISPIADLMKSEVYELAREIGVPQSILKSKPTDGLFEDDRSDEEQIGASYDELEWAMNYKGEDDSLTGRNKVVMEIYRKRHIANKHKMVPIPVCLIPRKEK